MFGDDDFEDLIDELLLDVGFNEVLEMNDLSEADVLRILIRGGHLGEPERVFSRYETESAD